MNAAIGIDYTVPYKNCERGRNDFYQIKQSLLYILQGLFLFCSTIECNDKELFVDQCTAPLYEQQSKPYI